MKKLEFRKKLTARQEKIKSLLCVGLDPLLEKMPDCLKTPGPAGSHSAADVALWMIKIVDATAPFTSMYKPQRAHWEAIPGGVVALQMVISYIEMMYPDIVVFTDCKRGDIDRTQACYRTAQFDIDGTEGMNFSPLMGKDCMQYLFDAENPGRALVGLGYTSNPSAREMQDVPMADGRPYWEHVVEKIYKWAQEIGCLENAGVVMAAAYEFPKKSGNIYSQHLTRIREMIGNAMWLLVPGVGTQGGYILQTVKAGFTGWGSMAINSSSGIIFASQGEDYAEKAADEARGLYVAIAKALEIPKSEWVGESLINSGYPLATLKNCRGYYNAKGDDGVIGSLVAYNGTYFVGGDVWKHYVGYEYYDFAYAEKIPAVRAYYAKIIAKNLRSAGIEPNVFLGSAYGGILLTGSLGDLFPGSETIFTTKKVLAVKTDTEKEKSEPSLERHKIKPGDKVVMVEDVENNYSGASKTIELVEAQGGVVIAIVCAFNRSTTEIFSFKHFGETDYSEIPVISACYIPTRQFRQDDPEIKELVEQNKVDWSPKNNFEKLLETMEEAEKK
jgi:orotidine-5'-phosphate decarboxylase